MEDMTVLEDLFDNKIISVLKIMFRDVKKKWYLQELSVESKVPMATCLRILEKFQKLELIDVEKVSRVKLYSLLDNKKVKFLSGIFKEDLKILDEFVERLKDLPGLKSIILHGNEYSDRANILLIGDDMDPGRIK